ncbi:hypothetical protein [Streptomyces sp. NPDC023588]
MPMPALNIIAIHGARDAVRAMAGDALTGRGRGRGPGREDGPGRPG